MSAQRARVEAAVRSLESGDPDDEKDDGSLAHYYW
jgi:hypothetical protein